MNARRTLFAAAATVAMAGACAGAPRSPPSARETSRARPAPIPPLSPARYAITETRGAAWDEARDAAPASRIEPAIVEGTRLLLDHGIVVASRRGPEPLSGFRSLPDRLGGGLVVWSQERTYRAADLLADLRPLVDVGATGGVRPWLGNVLLRTELGVLTMDVDSGATKHSAPGFADGVALDGARAFSIDLLGRARVTIDGGQTFTDLTATRGLWVTSMDELPGAVGLGAAPSVRLLWDGTLHPPPPEATPLPPYGAGLFAARIAPSPHSQASDSLAHAAVSGALIPGGRIVVGEDGGFVRILAAASGEVLAMHQLPDLGEAFKRCDPAWIQGEIVLACLHEHGAALLVTDPAFADVRLEATFPDASIFVAGAGARFGYAGRCGTDPELGGDFGREGAGGGASSPEADPPESPAVDPPRRNRRSSASPSPAMDVHSDDTDVLHFCARVEPGRWIERSLRGNDARHLYRWVPGDDGVVTALVLEDPKAGAPDAHSQEMGPVQDGVRIIRLDPHDPALAGASYRRQATRCDTPPFHAIDRDVAWDDAGAIVRTWVSLPAVDAAGADEPHAVTQEPKASSEQNGDDGSSSSAAGSTKGLTYDAVSRTLPLAQSSGGRLAGVDLSPSGRVALHALPADVIEVVSGGAFAIARAEKDGATQTLESTDGGASWRVVPDPPVGRIAHPNDESVGGCSAIGCAWADGVVRLGWGSPAESSSRPLEAMSPAKGARPRTLSPLGVTCRLDAPSRSRGSAARRSAGISAHRPARDTGPDSGSDAEAASDRDAEPGSMPEAALGPIQIRSPQGLLGASWAGEWNAAVTAPFLPSRPIRHVTLKNVGSDPMFGEVAPLLRAAKSDPPVDLVFRGERLRFVLGGAGSPSSFEGGESPVTAFAEVSRGKLVGFEASTREIELVDGAKARTLIKLPALAASTGVRLTLARRLGDGGIAILGYSTLFGEVFAGTVDLGRAEIGALSALGDLGALVGAQSPDCTEARLTHRFVAELPISLALHGTPQVNDAPERLTASALIEAGPDRECLVGLEVELANGSTLILNTRENGGGKARLRGPAMDVAATCDLAP